MREVFDVRDEEIAGKLSAALWNPDLMKQDPRLSRELLCDSMEQKNQKEERKIWGGLEKRMTLSIKKDRRIANEVRYGGVGDLHGENLVRSPISGPRELGLAPLEFSYSSSISS
jgi:hypothetical protein